MQSFHFWPFQLDLLNNSLRREGQPVPLRPRPLAVLGYLAAQAGRVVTRDELTQALWPGVHVTQTVLRVCIREIREALGDEAKEPRCIETVGRQGYRFIARLTTPSPAPSSQFSVRSLKARSGNWQLTTPFVGRERELRQLQQWWAEALAGQPRLVFVTGEAGVGKTTVIRRFLSQLQPDESAWIGWGQCIEQYGAGEAYLPLLEMLGRLGQTSGRDELVSTLRQAAPTWLAQLPGLVDATEFDTLQQRMARSGQQRMLRELSEALERLSGSHPMIVVLEDLHWSDYSTLEWLAMMARRQELARFLLIVSYRPMEVIVRDHPLRQLVQELRAHRQCEELRVESLTEQEVEEYVGRRFPGSARTAQLSQLIYERTDGNPLFMASFVDYLVQHELVSQETVPTARLPERLALPAAVEGLILKQIEGLSQQEQEILAAASAVGVDFTTASAAVGVPYQPEEVEIVCERLARQERLVEAREAAEWPDGTLMARYAFRHALYQSVLYKGLGEAQRIRLHRAIGQHLEEEYGARVGEIAGELALHFERGHDYERAVTYHTQAGERTLRRNAYQEALVHCTQGLELLQRLPETPQRQQHELTLRISLSAAQTATLGYGAAELGQNLERARHLCQATGDVAALAPVLIGLVRLYQVRADMQAARTVLAQAQQLLDATADPAVRLQVHTELGSVATWGGRHAQALTHHEQALALYDPKVHHELVLTYGYDPKAVTLFAAGWNLWLFGRPDEAGQRLAEAVRHAEQLAHPFTLLVVLIHGAPVLLFRHQPEAAARVLQKGLTLAAEYSGAYYLGMGTILQGYAAVQQGNVEEGIQQITQGLALYQQSESQDLLALFWSFLAEAYLDFGTVKEGLDAISKALSLNEKTLDRFWEPELYRLKGELLLAQETQKPVLSVVEGSKVKGQRSKLGLEAETYFLKAIEMARQRQAKSLELRAVMSVARLWLRQGKRTQAQHLLAEMYAWFTQGFDTKDLQEAKTLLAELAQKDSAAC